MVRMTYVGLGGPGAAVLEFERLTPHARALVSLQEECAQLGPDYMALGIALDGLETAAYHFTRRRHFYHQVREGRGHGGGGNGRLADRSEAIAAFEVLVPYARALSAMQRQCRPFGRDYLALDIARQGLETTAFHFTRVPSFYGAKADSAGRSDQAFDVRPIPTPDTATVGDYRRYPGCRLFLTCALCGWSKSCSPERIIDRLHQLKAGGHPTPITRVARMVGWDCPGCHRVKWRAQFAWPPNIDEREAKRLANLYRN